LQTLIRLLPDFLVKFFARPYVAGDSFEQGLEVMNQLLRDRKLLTSFDLLSEDISEREQVEQVRSVYRRMIAACAEFEEAIRPTVSLKPSSFTIEPLNGADGAIATGSTEAIHELVELAAGHRVRLTIDMEDRHWTDWTLDLLRDLHAEGHEHVGGVLQTRLNRTAADIAELPPGIRIRLVIGIYREPSDYAISDKRQMKQRMLDGARELLKRGHYVEFATHDARCVHRFVEEVVPELGVGADRFEIQMLYGVPRDGLQQRLVAGEVGSVGPIRTRLYVPFATSWPHAIAYCRRRLEENPSMATAVARNLARVLTGRH